ncbi:hypothetical protein AMAG_06586 [Allomyces macrogynus ATCC 38327]|uniref:Uncharacterized protein n=1 Tax=Allomyces macrogynus (strain ATCC 38327) TaxID=578462 RepID=A0A0L0SE45_ALLM3|nr:hypothetical protein AMAG_06586 [Allomyces macrogynus ATCC 38327]|eukprot:KNE60818.1 hypothetical protein AMAG_06586 [Allomyces macrogynus ATCC 38327]
MAVVTGFEFGVSPQDRVTTFSKVVAGAKVADLVTMVKGQLGGSSSSSGSSLIAGISDVDIAVQAGSKMSLSLALALNQSIPADINIGFVGATLGLNGNEMVSFAVDGIKATPATKKLAIKVSAEFFASQALGNDLRTLVLAVLQKKEVTGFLSVSRIVFGAKPDDNIALFSRAMIAVPIKDLLAMATAGGSASSLPMPKIKGFKDLKVIARPGDVIDSSFKLGLELPFNMSLSAPFIGLGLAVDKTPIVKVGVQGVVISPTQQDLSLGVRIQVVDTPEAQALVAALVKSVLFDKNPVTNILMIAGIQIGMSPTDVIKTFEAVVIPIPLQDLLKDLPASLPGAGGNSTLSLPPISAKNVSLDVQAGGLIDVKLVAVLTNLTFPAEIDIGYTSLTFGLNQNRLVTVAIDGLKVAPTTKELGLHLTLQFHDSDAVATDISALFTAVFNKREVTGFATLSGIVFGASRDDNIALLSKAVVAIPLSTFSKQLAAIPDAIGGIMAGVGKNPLPVKLKSVNFKALPGAIFNVATQLDLAIQIPLSVNLGFFNLDIQLGPLKALSLQVSGVKVTPDTKELSLALRVQIYDTPQLADVLAKVTGDIAGGNLNQVIVLTGVKLGLNADDNIKALSKVALPFNLEPLLKSAMGQLPAAGGNSTSSGGILDAIKPQVTEVKLVTLPQRIISLAAKASFSNPLPFNVDLGFLAVGVGVDGERIADVRVRGFTMAPGNNGINLDLSIQLSQGNADVVGGAIMDLLRGDFKDHRVSVLGLELGASESDHVRALSKSRIDVPFKALTTPEAIAKLRESLPAMLAGASGNLPVQFSDIKLNAQSPGKFIVTFAGAFTNSTSVTADVGFLQLAVAIGPKPDAMPSPPLVAIQLRGVKVEKNQLSGMIVLVPFDTDGNQAIVAGLLPFTFTLKGLKSLNVGLRAKGNPLINVAVQGLALDNSNKLSPVIDANIASVQVAAGTMQYVYESIKAGKSFEGLSVNGVALVLNDGSTFSLLSKIAADLPASKMDDFKFLGKIYNALKGEIDTKTLLEFSIPVEIAVGSLDFDVHTERGKVGEVRRRNLVINSNDGGFVVRIRSTLGLDIIELGRVLLNFEKEEKFLKAFNVKDPSGQDVAWATTVFNAVNVRLIPKWGKFDSPADI